MTAVELLERLTGLDADVMAAEELVKKLRARMVALERDSGLYATEGDLKGPGGDPVVRFDPRGYRGPSVKGKRMSECAPEALEALAIALTAMADSPAPDKTKYVAGNRKDAAKARTWARKIRATPPADAAAQPAAAPGFPGAPTFGSPSFGGGFAAPSFAPPSFAGLGAPTPTFAPPAFPDGTHVSVDPAAGPDQSSSVEFDSTAFLADLHAEDDDAPFDVSTNEEELF